MSRGERPIIHKTIPNEGEHRKNFDSLSHRKRLQKSSSISAIFGADVVNNETASTREFAVSGNRSRVLRRKKKQDNLEKKWDNVTLVKPDHVVDEWKWNEMVKYFPFVS